MNWQKILFVVDAKKENFKIAPSVCISKSIDIGIQTS